MEVVIKRGVTCVRLDDGTIVKQPEKVEELMEEMEEWTSEDSSTQLDLIE